MVRLENLNPLKCSGLVLNISKICRWPSITVQSSKSYNFVRLFRISILGQILPWLCPHRRTMVRRASSTVQQDLGEGWWLLLLGCPTPTISASPIAPSFVLRAFSPSERFSFPSPEVEAGGAPILWCDSYSSGPVAAWWRKGAALIRGRRGGLRKKPNSSHTIQLL